MDRARAAGVPVTINRIGSMFTVFFTEGPVNNLTDAKTCDTEKFGRFYHRMRKGGVSLPPSQFEAAFLSTVHGDDEIERILDVAEEAFGAVS